MNLIARNHIAKIYIRWISYIFTDIDTSDLKDISPHKKDTDPAQIMSNT